MHSHVRICVELSLNVSVNRYDVHVICILLYAGMKFFHTYIYVFRFFLFFSFTRMLKMSFINHTHSGGVKILCLCA